MNAQILPTKSSSTSTILAVILLVISIVGIFVFLLPEKDSLDLKNKDLNTKKTELQQLKQEVVKFEELQQAFEGGEVTQNDVINLIPPTVEENEVIKILANLSDQNEVTLNSLSFGINKGSDTDVNILNITTNVSGAHQSLIKFLESLENESRKFRVKTLSVQTLQNRLENMSLNIEAYFL